MNKGFDQVAAFQKLWTDSFANMAGVWSQFSPGSPPTDEMRKMRGGMLKVLAETWDEYMRTPQFMEMMKASLNGALDLKRMARDGMNRVHRTIRKPQQGGYRWRVAGHPPCGGTASRPARRTR